MEAWCLRTSLMCSLMGFFSPRAPLAQQFAMAFRKRAGRVLQLAINGSVIQTIQIEGEPGGLGWLPDSSLICVSMQSRSLVRISRQGVIGRYVDLSSLTTFRCNDMVIDKRGNAYVGDFGYDMSSGHAPSPGVLVLVPLGGRRHELLQTNSTSRMDALLRLTEQP